MFIPVKTYGWSPSISRLPSRHTKPSGTAAARAAVGAGTPAGYAIISRLSRPSRYARVLDAMAVSSRNGGPDGCQRKQREQQVCRAAHGDVRVEGHQHEDHEQAGERGDGRGTDRVPAMQRRAGGHAYADPREVEVREQERHPAGPQQPGVPALDVDRRGPGRADVDAGGG